MLVGYARVSTQDQKLELQRDALKEAKCNASLRTALQREAPNAPGWLFPTLQKIAQSEALK